MTREETDQLLSVCDPTWRTIIGLTRYAGLRCPSEVLSLKWEHVNWQRDRMTVISPKTERYQGGAERVVPIFADLRPILDDAYSLAEDGAIYVVGGNYREAANSPRGWRSCNLRTQLERLIRRAGLKPWPKLMHAMRASCETDLIRQHSIHVVTAWIGHSPKVAVANYLRVTDLDFEQAAGGGAKSGAVVVQKAVQQVDAGIRTDWGQSSQAVAFKGALQLPASRSLLLQKDLAERTGFE